MTPRLAAHLRSVSRIHTGHVVANDASVAMTEGDAKHGIYRVCRAAGLPERSWHTLRHAWGDAPSRYSGRTRCGCRRGSGTRTPR